ncbi:sensor histidine kinase [Clostridium sp. AF19-22AC]|jgi:signal transduction histidine kinase|uniref:sensor histidine kinase n=1 Tax=Clostridia TaxID=186801 RepID=UPI000E4DEFC2|nr:MULTISPECIES: sensor histidine kinase [Clostridia]RHR25284.1 sensor histidine kinase [Clostridium sp. AF19-22AC]
MKKLISYLRTRSGLFVVYLLILFIFTFILYLHNISSDALGYAILLSAVIYAAACIAGFVRYCRHTSRVREALEALPDELRELPGCCDMAEELYQEKIRQLFQCKTDIETNGRISRQDMLDYYSLWAHQIKTPISAMRLLLQSFEEEEMEEQQTEFIPSMKMELFKTEQYVEMVMSYLRMEDMSSDLSLNWYETDQIVRQAVRKYSQLFILQRIRLDYRECEGRVLTDEKWMLFVLEQLLSNALKYTNKGSISIYMDPLKEGVLIIEDTGIGIQAEDLPRIFEKGFTGYNGRKDKKSTGIGLYLCKSICTKLNHGLTVESEVGKGTKVKLDLYRKPQIVE